jgi:hypothetical protein
MTYRILPAVLLLACNNGSNDLLVEGGLSLASGVTITRVAIYQGPGTTLSANGVGTQPNLPLIAGRDALVRVFYEAPGRAGDAVNARFDFSEDDGLETTGTLVETSVEDDLASTLNFTVPGDAISESGLTYRVYVVDDGDAPREDTLGAIHPDEGFEVHATEAPHVFRVTIVPYQYNADGSGRVPDTSPAAVAAFEDRFRQLYPISDIELTIHDPIAWSGSIQPNGTGWQEVGFNLYGLRAQEGADDDEYYYGMFDPASSLNQFCGAGCLLGVTLLNNDPSTTGDPNLNLALGVGFPEQAADTMLHEIGHAHGRPHAPCGPGLDPSSIDASYPYSDGLINETAYDVVGGGLVSANSADIMSYCYPQWISAYNYVQLWDRMDAIRSVGQARTLWADTPGEIVFVDGEGAAEWAGAVPKAPTLVGEPVDVRAGFATELAARFVRYDHLPGGWLVLPELGPELDELAFEVDGVAYSVLR